MPRIVGLIDKSTLHWDRPSSIVLLPECNFSCIHCNQWKLVHKWHKLPTIKEDDALSRIARNRNKIEGVVVTGGEPLMHELDDFLRDVKGLGLPIKIETNGSFPKYLERLLRIGMVDFASVDIKAPLKPGKYSQICGVRVDTTEIGMTVYKLIHSDYDYEFTMTPIPGIQTAIDVEEVAKSLKGGKKLVLQYFEPSYKMRNAKPFSPEEMKRFKDIASENLPTAIR